MRYSSILASLFILIAATACRSAPLLPGDSIPTTTETYSPQVSQTAVIEQPLARTPTITPLSPTSLSPSPLSPTPPSPFDIAPISSENASRLRPAQQHAFSPWEHVLAIVWSPGGEALAVAAGDAVYIFDSQQLEDKLRLEPGVAAAGLSFSPDGKLLAAGDRNGVLHVWDARNGQVVHEMQAHLKSISSLAYSPDGSTLATAGYDAVARMWDAGSYAELSEMIGGTFAIPAIAYTPDGNSLAIVNGNVIRLRDAETGRFVRTIVGTNSFYSLAFSPDGRYLATGDVENTIQIWDLNEAPGPGGETRASLYTLSGHSGRENRPEALIWQVAYSPQGSLLVSAGGDATIRLWDAATAQPVATLSGHNKAATSAAFSPDGRWLATGGLDGVLILWGVGN